MDDKKFYQSKKWWTAIIAAVIPLANAAFGWGLNSAEITAVVLPFIAYIIGQAWDDATH